MKSLLRRIVKLEQHAETVPIDLPPLPPPGASEAELRLALHEAWRQLQAHPHQPGRFLHLVQIAQRFGITSKVGAEDFRSAPSGHEEEEEAIPIVSNGHSKGGSRMDTLTSSAEAALSPFVFIRDWARTFDEVEAGKQDGRLVRAFPRKDYIEAYINEWQEHSILLVPKSRRMLATWTFCALDYWLAAFRSSVKVFIASTMRTKSDALLARCKFIHDHLPEPLAFPKPVMEVKNGQKGDPTRLIFPKTGSVIQSVSEDPDELRQEGATLIHCEEFAHWQWQDKAWTAMRPVVQGGGKIVVVSTPRAGTFFRDLVFDEGSIRSEVV